MTCKDLGGACDKEFHADTFEDMAQQSKAHAMAMFQQGDKAHLDAMKAMQEQMKSPDAMQKYIDDKRRKFDALP